MGDKLGGGQFFYALVVIGAVVIIGWLFTPTANTLLNAVDTTGWLPITEAAVVGLPYAFAGFIIYIAFTVWKHGASK